MPLAVAGAKFCRDQKQALSKAQGVARQRDAYASPRRELAEAARANALMALGLVGDDPQHRELAGREIGSERRRQRAGRGKPTPAQDGALAIR